MTLANTDPNFSLDKSEPDPIFSKKVTRDAEAIFYQIRALAKVGIAASDTAMNVNLSEGGGHQEFYEVIGRLAMEGIAALGGPQR